MSDGTGAAGPAVEGTSLRDRLLRAVDIEPELTDEMPDEMWAALRDDRDATVEALRIVVRQTKAAIRARIEELLGEHAMSGSVRNENRHVHEDLVEKHWVCSRCASGNPEGVGRRFRFPYEPCPTCGDPGVGMVLVPKENHGGSQ